MARLFGLVSKREIDLTFSVEYRLGAQIHGWGLLWYETKTKLKVIKGIRSTVNASVNKPFSHKIFSSMVLSHLRQATSGSVSKKNTHPFLYGRYAFAHNGHVHKEKLFAFLKPPYNEQFKSDIIDSEVYFRYILQSIKQHGEEKGIKHAVKQANNPRGSNFILTTGETLYAYRYGLPLYYARWQSGKPFQAGASTGVSFSSTNLSEIPSILVSSEQLTEGNWNVFDDNELLTIHANLEYDLTKVL